MSFVDKGPLGWVLTLPTLFLRDWTLRSINDPDIRLDKRGDTKDLYPVTAPSIFYYATEVLRIYKAFFICFRS